MPNPVDNISSSLYDQVIQDQLPKLEDKIGESVVRNTPYMSLVDTKVIDFTNHDKNWQTTVANRAYMEQNVDVPDFRDVDTAVGWVPDADSHGFTKYTTTLQEMRGIGPQVSFVGGRHAVATSLRRTEEALAKEITLMQGNRIRASIMGMSGVKWVCTRAGGIDTITGNQKNLSADWEAVTPDAAPTWATIKHLNTFMREEMDAQPFGEDMGGGYLTLIAGQNLIQKLRAEEEVNGLVAELVRGGYNEGKALREAYSFLNFRNQGIQLGVDPYPLRYNALDGNDDPVILPSTIKSTDDYAGAGAKINPAWRTAEYEIAFLVARDAFGLILPKLYTGEASFKFNPRMVSGRLKWVHESGTRSDIFGDVGFHAYRIENAIEPLNPHFVLPIAYRRPAIDMGVENVGTANP